MQQKLDRGVVVWSLLQHLKHVDCWDGVQGTAPCLAVDNTSGCQLYLGPAALSTAVTTAKSSEVNVLVPGATADEELVSKGEACQPLPFSHVSLGTVGEKALGTLGNMNQVSICLRPGTTKLAAGGAVLSLSF